MGTGKLFLALVIIVLNFLLWVFLETKLQRFFTLELIIIVFGVLLGLILLAGIATSARWAWPFATIFFSLALANALFLYWNIGAWKSFLLLIFLNTAGLLMGIASTGSSDEEFTGAGDYVSQESPAAPVETYALGNEPSVTFKTGSRAGRKKR